jgi:hypothetical protein
MAATHESLALFEAVRALDFDGELSDVEIEEIREALRDARGVLANPLAYPPRDEKDRAVVKQGTVEVRGLEIPLGALDIENALILRCVFPRRSKPDAEPRRKRVARLGVKAEWMTARRRDFHRSSSFVAPWKRAAKRETVARPSTAHRPEASEIDLSPVFRSRAWLVRAFEPVNPSASFASFASPNASPDPNLPSPLPLVAATRST